jgi:hypothetical protein
MEHPIISKVTSSDTIEWILNEWMLLARHNKKLHDAAAKYYKLRADICMIYAIILGSTSGLRNIALGSIELISFVLVNGAQICLGAVGLISAGIVTVSKQLELETNVIQHLEYTVKYSKLHRMIRSELVLLKMNDSSYASTTDFLKTCQNELNRIEELAPSIPLFIEEKLGSKCVASQTQSPGTMVVKVNTGDAKYEFLL